MTYSYLGKTVRVAIKYKNRSSIGITIDGYQNIEVQAPKGTLDDSIEELLEKNWTPIQQKLNEIKERQNGPKKKSYSNGERFLYLGNAYPIEIIEDECIQKEHVIVQGNKLLLYVKAYDEEKIQQIMKRFYYKQCKVLIEKSISTYQSYFKMKPRAIRITESKTTWGTSDANHQLTFNRKLAMAPQEVIDYVVIHEMCHMVHLNHDRSFWRLVGKIMPDYKDKENWLTSSGWKMTV
ncbi:M48 family metallopeptidase [Caldibacillus lycopersici]|uniref:M48 family metallopeptidase n=1 Tax=Perspicuibacillus lycopersici TaxID=1325689 RepID=A0AAE3IU01_9BACI|nr:SprT family zinc-dependent metalloprotease [Perspicuibacillus lycopersici]MCU9614377.1 M48 family metallopeptidase [Perspicuibacillus lycopersici]